MMHFDSKEKVITSVDTQIIGVLSMRSKWTERLKDIFKSEAKQSQIPHDLDPSPENRKVILARKIMKVMKDPYPPEETSSKKPKP